MARQSHVGEESHFNKVACSTIVKNNEGREHSSCKSENFVTMEEKGFTKNCGRLSGRFSSFRRRVDLGNVLKDNNERVLRPATLMVEKIQHTSGYYSARKLPRMRSRVSSVKKELPAFKGASVTGYSYGKAKDVNKTPIPVLNIEEVVDSDDEGEPISPPDQRHNTVQERRRSRIPRQDGISTEKDYKTSSVSSHINGPEKGVQGKENYQTNLPSVQPRFRSKVVLKEPLEKQRIPQSTEKGTPRCLRMPDTRKKVFTPLAIQSKYNMRGTPLFRVPSFPSKWRPQADKSGGAKSQQQEAFQTVDVAPEVLSQECCRVLHFESGDEATEFEEHTAPLAMMVQTPIISRASVLQDPVSQPLQQKSVLEPVYKKNLFNQSTNVRRFGRRRSIQQPKPLMSGDSLKDKEETSVFETFDCAIPLSTRAITGYKMEQENTIPQNTLQQSCTVKKFHVKEEGTSTQMYTNPSCARNVRISRPLFSTKKPMKRRSAIVYIRTPSARNTNVELRPKSTSKIPQSFNASMFPKHDRSQIHSKQAQISITSSSRSCLHLETTQHNMVVSDCDVSKQENEMGSSVKHESSCKVDASTNTKINITQYSLPDLQVLEDINGLIKEQEELNRKAKMLLEKITARRREMNENGLMESFMTSAPMRRLRAMLPGGERIPAENRAQDNDCTKNTEPIVETKVDSSDGALEESPRNPDKSMFECSSFKTPTSPDGSQTQQDRQKQDNRLLPTSNNDCDTKLTCQGSQSPEEVFLRPEPGSASPFTKLVGDCDRPSLAPMTPHSRQHVSFLKTCLKKQLEDLYD